MPYKRKCERLQRRPLHFRWFDVSFVVVFCVIGFFFFFFFSNDSEYCSVADETFHLIPGIQLEYFSFGSS